MTTYVVTSARLSRKRGQTFTDDEIPGEQIATLIAGGHLREQAAPEASPESASPEPAVAATNTEEQ